METIVKTCDNKTVGRIKEGQINGHGENSVLTERQIRNRVGDGWAVIQDPEYNGAIFLKGKLLYHSTDRKQALVEFGKRKEKHLLFKYCGKLDPNVVYIL